MKLCIVSDIHRKENAHAIVKRIVPDADLYIDCGDSEYSSPQIQQLKREGWICVKGNMDYIFELKDKEYFQAAGYKFLVMHGNRMTYRTFDEDVDIIIRGHSHVYGKEEKNGKIIINPGSFSKPRDYDLAYGLGEFCTVTIDEEKNIQCDRIIINLKEEYKRN